ncbi:MAG: TonB-dependent receptor [Candidatus Omnitrophica bacterium]|nr:TonB-dependent receptor [Candidatus Omnitrophota bacterium]
MNKVALILCAAIVLLSASLDDSVCAQQDDQDFIRLDPIFVTPMRSRELESRTPASVSVITRKKIENSNAQSTIGLLRNETGIFVKDWIGNGTSAQVDIRGFGEQAQMNVAVLVDGRRVNEVDLSGVDWTQIPIDQIERIEIIRGGAGAVLYGDNATSGVINIITKSGRGEPYVNYTQRYGSYDMNEEKIELGGSVENLSFILRGGRKAIHGYRNNSYFNNWDFFSKLIYDIDPEFALRVSQSWHRSEYGLPGAISATDLEAHDRTFSSFGDDYVKNTDWNFSGGFDKTFGSWGSASCDFFYRRRYVYSNYIGANAGWNPIRRATIDTYGITPKYVMDRDFFGFANKLVTGLDYYREENDSDVYTAADLIQSITAVKKNTIAWYGQDSFSVFPELTVVGGFRYEHAGYDLDYQDLTGWNPTIDTHKKKIARMYNLGIIYEYMGNSEIFCTHNTSFRFPATDEYIVWGALNPNLKEQISRNYEVGIRQAIGEKARVEITGYWMNLKNEIFYNPLGGIFGTGANENYGKTRHQGLEVSAKAEVFENIELFGNYTFTNAKFVDDTYDDKYIPMVPSNKGSAGIRVYFLEYFTFNFVALFVGERHCINDQQNIYEPLKPYATFDLNFFYENDQIRLGAGINNLFNEKFYHYSVRNANNGRINYYPAEGINLFLEGTLKF